MITWGLLVITWGLLVLTCDYTYDCTFHVYIDKHIYIYITWKYFSLKCNLLSISIYMNWKKKKNTAQPRNSWETGGCSGRRSIDHLLAPKCATEHHGRWNAEKVCNGEVVLHCATYARGSCIAGPPTGCRCPSSPAHFSHPRWLEFSPRKNKDNIHPNTPLNLAENLVKKWMKTRIILPHMEIHIADIKPCGPSWCHCCSTMFGS